MNNAPLIEQPDAAPTRKVVAMTVMGGVITVAVWAATEFVGLDVPNEVQGALHTAAAALIGYFVRDRMNS